MHAEPTVLHKEFVPIAKKKKKASGVLAAAACSCDDELNPEEEQH
jgi:hypothetical protein